MGDVTATTGVSRRDLIKRTAAAGAVVWASPVMSSSAAWGEHVSDCNECDGLTIYSKYAPGNSQTEGNQCLSPCEPVTVLSSQILIDACVLNVVDTVESGENRAGLGFSEEVRLIRTAIKSTSDCYFSICQDDFCTVYRNDPGTNATCDEEHLHEDTDPFAPPTDPSPPIFRYYTDEAATQLCGQSHGGGTGEPACGCASNVRAVRYNTDGIGRSGKPLNFIEVILCLKGTTIIPGQFCDA